MIQLQPVRNHEPALSSEPVIRAAQLRLGDVAEHSMIGLTSTKALERKFVH